MRPQLSCTGAGAGATGGGGGGGGGGAAGEPKKLHTMGTRSHGPPLLAHPAANETIRATTIRRSATSIRSPCDGETVAPHSGAPSGRRLYERSARHQTQPGESHRPVGSNRQSICFLGADCTERRRNVSTSAHRSGFAREARRSARDPSV